MKTCPDCGECVYNNGCVNCNEAAYIEEQKALTESYGSDGPIARPIYAKCNACGRTLTGDYETRNGVCASFVGCLDRSRRK